MLPRTASAASSLNPPQSAHTRGGDGIARQQVGDLVRLHAVMERADPVAELARDVDHLRHLVGAIAVIVDEDVAAQHLGERLEPEIARRRLALVVGVPLVPLAAVLLGLDPRGAIAGDVAHARRRAARRVDALRILAARHLQSVLRAGKLHPLHGARRNDLQHHAASADEIGRSGEHLDRRDAAGEAARELWILRPHRVLDPHVRR